MTDPIGRRVELGVVAMPARARALEERLAAGERGDGQGARALAANLIHPGTLEAAVAFFRSEQERYAKIVKRSDIRLD